MSFMFLCNRMKQSKVSRTYIRIIESNTTSLFNYQLSNPNRPFINARFFAAPVQAVKKQEDKDKSGPRMNEKITADFIRLVVPDGEHRVISRREALQRAKDSNLDLVEVQRFSDPPVCKLMDFHKEKYIKQVKEKERSQSKKKEVTLKKSTCKEIRFAIKTDKKDLQTKADSIIRLMERGYRVKCMAMGTKEEDDLGGLLSRLSTLIQDVAIVESGPRVEKKQAYVIVRHTKFGPSKKGHLKKLSTVLGTTDTDVSKVATDTSTSDDLTSIGSDSDIVDDILSDDDDMDTNSDEYFEKGKSTWSASDTAEDFEKVFDFSDEKGKTLSSQTQFSDIPPKPVLDPIREKVGPPSQPKPPFQNESRYTRNEPQRNNIQPTKTTGNQQGARNEKMSFGAFSAPKNSVGRHDTQQRNKEVTAPKQEKPSSDSSKSAPSGYGIFSNRKN